jgi:transposase
MAKQRKHYTSEEKVSILRRRLLEGVAVSTLCDELSLKPTVFYRWQKAFFENGVAAFGPWHRSGQVGEQHRSDALEQKLQRMNHVLAVLMEEYVAQKEHAAEVRT